MELLKLKCIKNNNNEYFDLASLVKLSSLEEIYLYAPIVFPLTDNENYISDLLGIAKENILTDKECLDNNAYKWLKRLTISSFNCLLKKQNYLLISYEKQIKFEIPYSYISFIKDMTNIQVVQKKIDQNMNASISDFFENLLLYNFTKDIRVLNKLISNYDINDISIFMQIDNFIQGKVEAFSIICNLMHKRIQPNSSDANSHKLKTQHKIENYQSLYNSHKRHEKIQKENCIKAIEKDNRDKNLIMIHLESISNLILFQNRNLLPSLNKVMAKSLRFNKYYSSATSTVMALSSIFYGNDFELDAFKSYETVKCSAQYGKNLFYILSQHGYVTTPITLTGRNIKNDIHNMNIWNDGKTAYQFSHTFQEFKNKIKTFIEQNKLEKFALFINNELTHVGVYDDQTIMSNLFEDKMKLSYLSLNETVHFIMELLKEYNLLDNTTVVFYGDHGDDKWTRSMNSGFTHVIAPYQSVTSTPLFLYDTRLGSGELNNLTSSIDLKHTILYLLGISDKDAFTYSGINVFKEQNQYIFSASLFLNQAVEEPIENIEMIKLNKYSRISKQDKSFSISDGQYALVVNNKGMQLYHTVTDGLNYNNLLSFYQLDADGKAIKFQNHGAWRGHFRSVVMTDAQIYKTLHHFEDLKENLIKRLCLKMKLIGDTEKNSFDLDNFKKVVPRGFHYD